METRIAESLRLLQTLHEDRPPLGFGGAAGSAPPEGGLVGEAPAPLRPPALAAGRAGSLALTGYTQQELTKYEQQQQVMQLTLERLVGSRATLV